MASLTNGPPPASGLPAPPANGDDVHRASGRLVASVSCWRPGPCFATRAVLSRRSLARSAVRCRTLANGTSFSPQPGACAAHAAAPSRRAGGSPPRARRLRAAVAGDGRRVAVPVKLGMGARRFHAVTRPSTSQNESLDVDRELATHQGSRSRMISSCPNILPLVRTWSAPCTAGPRPAPRTGRARPSRYMLRLISRRPIASSSQHASSAASSPRCRARSVLLV